jgi:hypothetical protein
MNTATNETTATADPPDTARYLSRQQLARRWGVSVRAIVKWEMQQRLRATRFGAAVRYGIDEIEAFEQAGK